LHDGTQKKRKRLVVHSPPRRALLLLLLLLLLLVRLLPPRPLAAARLVGPRDPPAAVVDGPCACSQDTGPASCAPLEKRGGGGGGVAKGVGAVPSVLQWQYRRLVHYPFTILKYLSDYGCSPNEFLGPTSLGNEDESNGLHGSPNDIVYTTHAVLILSDDALAIHDPCSWTDRKVTKGHPHGQSWKV
jgi:hypothetical protein